MSFDLVIRRGDYNSRRGQQMTCSIVNDIIHHHLSGTVFVRRRVRCPDDALDARRNIQHPDQHKRSLTALPLSFLSSTIPQHGTQVRQTPLPRWLVTHLQPSSCLPRKYTHTVYCPQRSLLYTETSLASARIFALSDALRPLTSSTPALSRNGMLCVSRLSSADQSCRYTHSRQEEQGRCPARDRQRRASTSQVLWSHARPQERGIPLLLEGQQHRQDLRSLPLSPSKVRYVLTAHAAHVAK